MIEHLIAELREKLEKLIDEEASYQEIYAASITLDELIVAFYTSGLKKKCS
jgi:hypothetical protein